MKRLYLDTNILLDFALKRPTSHISANEVFALAGDSEVELFVSALSFVTLAYVDRRSSPALTRQLPRSTLPLVNVVPLEASQLSKAAAPDSPFPDTEDAMQHAAAHEAGCEIILTRDLDDFEPSTIPVMTAADYLSHRAAGTLP